MWASSRQIGSEATGELEAGAGEEVAVEVEGVGGVTA
jgi:hypothetical protein